MVKLDKTSLINNLNRNIEEDLKKISHIFGAKELIVSSILDKEDFEKTGYNKLFNGQSMSILNQKMQEVYLSPTVCYPIFSNLQTKKLNQVSGIYFSISSCFRNEKKLDFSHKQVFDMAEFVFIGRKDKVFKDVEKLKKYILNYFNSKSLDVSIKIATDAFFLQSEHERELLQKLEMSSMSKEEFVWHSKNGDIPLGSVNIHNEKYIKSFFYKNNSNMISACLGVGIDRLAMALEEKL